MGETNLRYYRPASLDFLRDFEMDAREIIREGTYTNGQRAQELCDKLAHRTGYTYAISFGSGTQAIFLLARWYWKMGYRNVRVPAFTWPSTYLPFSWLGYNIAFVDIDKETWLADFGDIKPGIGTLSIGVDTFGSVFPYDESVWDRNPKGETGAVPFIDSAQSFGAKWTSTDPHRIVSLSGSKILTSGEGGILFTQSEALADFAANQSWFSRLPELSAVLGLAYLDHFDDILEKKRRIADAYRARFPHLGWQKCENTNNYIVAALVDSPREWAKVNDGIEMRFYYTSAVSESDERVPIVSLPSLPNTDYVSRHIVAFPAFPDMDLAEIEKLEEPK